MGVTRLVREPARLRIRFFSSASDSARARRPTDVVLAVLSIVTIGLASLVNEGTSAFETALTSFVMALPGLLGWFWETCDVSLSAWAVVLVGAALFAHGRRSLVSGIFPQGVQPVYRVTFSDGRSTTCTGEHL